MGFMNEIGSLLRQYQGGGASTMPAGNVEQDYQRVTQQVPQSSVAGALSDAFRSNQTPPFAQIVSQLFGQSNGEQKAGILNHLLSAAGPGALSGPLAGLSSLLGSGSSISPEQVHQVSPETVQDLAQHAEKQDASIVDRAGEFYAQHPTLVQGLGAGALALVMSRISHSS